jgi:hypothetical protein
MEYITDVSTTKLSSAFLNQLPDEYPKGDFLAFTVYFRTFDVIRTSYHGKVRSGHFHRDSHEVLHPDFMIFLFLIMDKTNCS